VLSLILVNHTLYFCIRWCWKTNEVFPLQRVNFVGKSTFVPKNTDMPLEIMYGNFMVPEKGRKFKPKYGPSGFVSLYWSPAELEERKRKREAEKKADAATVGVDDANVV
jgi:hypothetical protein